MECWAKLTKRSDSFIKKIVNQILNYKGTLHNELAIVGVDYFVNEEKQGFTQFINALKKLDYPNINSQKVLQDAQDWTNKSLHNREERKLNELEKKTH